MLFWILLILIVGLLAYIRLAPTDVARWHIPVDATQDKDLPGGAVRILPATETTLQSLHDIALQTPRTSHVAGSVADGHVTYQTRSFWIGFPDYTTAQIVDGQLRLHARLRFGKLDMDVNRARLEAWSQALKN